jgi:hypothetical protein
MVMDDRVLVQRLDKSRHVDILGEIRSRCGVLFSLCCGKRQGQQPLSALVGVTLVDSVRCPTSVWMTLRPRAHFEGRVQVSGRRRLGRTRLA